MQTGILRLFCDAAVTQSFALAARLNGCTPSNARQSFRLLERICGMPLAETGRRRIRLLPAGEIVHDYSGRILRLADELDRRLRKSRTACVDHLELAVCHSIGFHHLPPLLDRFRALCRDTEINVRYSRIDRVHKDVLDNEVDLGLVAYPRRLPGLKIESIGREPLMLACHPQHPLAALPAVTLPMLKGHDIILWNEIPWPRLLRGVRNEHRHLFEPRHEFRELEQAKGAVKADLGVALLPAAALRPDVDRGLLAAVPFENGRHAEPLAAIWRRWRKVPSAVEQFIEFLKQPESGSSPVGTGEDVRRTGEG